MKYIQKIKTGKGYKQLLKIHKANGSYDDTKDDKSKNLTIKTDILKELLAEQNGICAYCMRTIRLENATIEHIIGQSYVDDKGKKIGKKEDTNYNNMLAVCQGNFCFNKTHCDTSRSNYQDKKPLLSISPLNELHMNHIKFTQSGVIYYEELNAKTEMNDDLDRVLNLNCEGIKERRVKVLRAITKSLQKCNFNKKIVQKLLEHWENRDIAYKDYCQVAIFKLKKYL
jgi:uncharacterized protein (TIGR02646 family)